MVLKEILTQQFLLWSLIFQIVAVTAYFFGLKYRNVETLATIILKPLVWVIPAMIAIELYRGHEFLFFIVNYGLAVIWIVIVSLLWHKKKVG